MILKKDHHLHKRPRGASSTTPTPPIYGDEGNCKPLLFLLYHRFWFFQVQVVPSVAARPTHQCPNAVYYTQPSKTPYIARLQCSCLSLQPILTEISRTTLCTSRVSITYFPRGRIIIIIILIKSPFCFCELAGRRVPPLGARVFRCCFLCSFLTDGNGPCNLIRVVCQPEMVMIRQIVRSFQMVRRFVKCRRVQSSW